MQIKNIHEKLLESVQILLIDTKINLPFYGNFNLFVNFHESKNIPTCGVNMTPSGMNFYYNSKFLQELSQKEVNFIVLHEDFHLLWDHPKRTITGQYDHKLANIAQDMIINHIIFEDIVHDFIEIPKDKDGKNMALFVPKEYKGELIFEQLYEWLRDEQEKHEKKGKKNGPCKSCGGTGKKDQCQGQQDGQNGQGQGQQGQGQQDGQNGQGQQDGQNGQGQQGQGQQDGQGQHGNGQGESCPDCDGTGGQDGMDSQGNPSYGPYAKNPSQKSGGSDTIDSWSLDSIFDNLDTNNGQYLDSHIGDDIPEEMRESMIRDSIDRLKSRGLGTGNIEQTLNKLRKKRKDYLKYIKRSLSTLIFGTKKEKTITKPNRRQITGVKGVRKVKTKINVILDCSGSMSGLHERVLSYIYRNDIECNIIIADTEIKSVGKIRTKKDVERIKLSGFGGTAMQSSFDYIAKNLNQYNNLLLTDGYTDSLDLSEIKGNTLIITCGSKCPISKTNGKLKQIVIDSK